MSIFRVYVDGQIFYHPHLSKLAITEATVSEDAENIDSFPCLHHIIIPTSTLFGQWHQ